MGLFTSKQTNTDAPVEETKTPAAKTAPKPAKKEKSAEKGKAVSQAYRVLIHPIVSEKASHQQPLNQYFFAVALDANRIEVAKAVKEVYGVAPVKVNILRGEGKNRRFGRIMGRRKNWKKAIVTLPKGKTISLYEGV